MYFERNKFNVTKSRHLLLLRKKRPFVPGSFVLKMFELAIL